VRRPSAPEALAAFFVVAGKLHFVAPRPYEVIVPPALGHAREIVYLSGAAEIAGGLAVLPRATRPWAGLWLTALLVAVFPANVYHAVAADRIPGQPVPKPLLWLRLPLQAVLVRWTWSATGASEALARR
jgi:uncharacterized membrane protein